MLFSVSYLLLGWIGNRLSLEISGFTYFWPPCGLFLAVLLSVPQKQWTVFVSSGMVASYLTGLLFGVPPLLNAAFAMANAAEAVAGAWTIRRYVAPRLDLSTLKQTVAGLLVIGALGASAVAAIIGATAATAVSGAWSFFAANCYDWWMGNVLGTITIAAVMLTWPRAEGRPPLGALRLAEGGFVAVAFVVGAFAFLSSDAKSYDNHLFVFIPCMVWVAIRFGQFASSIASLALLFVVIAATRNSIGIDHDSLVSSFHTEQIFALLVASMNLILSTVIVERDQREQQLRESKLRLDTILDNVGAHIFIKDADYRYLYVNHITADLFGRAAEDIVGNDDSAFFSKDSVEEIMKSDSRIIENGESVRREETIVVQEGKEYRTYWTVKVPLRDHNGHIYGLCGISTDITEHKALEENLHRKTCELEQELAERQLAQEALLRQAGILEKEIEERKRAEERVQQSEATVRGKLRAILEPDGDIGTLELSDIVDCETLRGLLEDFYQLTGILGAVLDTRGNVLISVGWQDICTRFHRCHPETVKNCIESDTFLTAGVPAGTFKHYRCKNNMWDMVTPLEVAGRHVGNVFIGQFFYEDEEPDVELFREQARRCGFDEEEYLAALARVPRFSREKAQTGIRFYAKLTKMVSELSFSSIKLSRILNERIHLEEQLRQSQKMEVIGKLAGGVAHDFNNILQVISGYGALLQMDRSLNGKQRDEVDQILSSVEKGAQLTHGLLAFSRKQVMTLSPVDLNDVVNKVRKFLARIIGEDVQLKTVIHPDRLVITADAGQLEQVLINLATNARDAMQKGGRLTIETGLQEIATSVEQESGRTVQGDHAVLTVSDTGCGMDETCAKRVFEPFYTTKEVGKGTGLGMSIVYGIVKQHNGFINVYSEPGLGTAFKIYLPIDGSQIPAQAGAAEACAPPRGEETILLAEDDESVRKLIVSVLTEFGYRVIQAVDGEDAVEKFAAHRDTVAMVLMDMIMPRKNGREAYEEISAIRPGVKVLFSSGYTADFIQNRGVSEEGIELIMKPMQPKELLRRIRKVLDQ
ncbi:PocR ligand-binding domain-containing protein [Geomonas sp. Red32]|uniref:PocR ligand-binding domain-containing protein n=1 Tax=Geomonas sp. Red32 TaxID=2912856 RepID=UPI00202D05EE|nr:PocR ligand-binding domain-containing protein [Geomonas sp. Red32]